MKTRQFKYMYIETFTAQNRKFSDKKSDIFHISAQNIDCGYSLEPPRRGGSNGLDEAVLTSTHKLCFWAETRKIMYAPCKPQFDYIKVGFKGVKII